MSSIYLAGQGQLSQGEATIDYPRPDRLVKATQNAGPIACMNIYT